MPRSIRDQARAHLPGAAQDSEVSSQPAEQIYHRGRGAAEKLFQLRFFGKVTGKVHD